MTAPEAAPGALRLTIWGAGGSAPTGRSSRAVHGGDTVCFELRREAPGAVPLVIDLGTGARDLGLALAAEAAAKGRRPDAEVLISHFHLDHLMGMPFFKPFYDPEAVVRVRAGIVGAPSELERTLGALASSPYFPVRPLDMGAARFGCFEPGETFVAADLRVTAIGLNHPGGCCGFRVEGAHGAICVIGDHEHGNPAIDAAVARAVRGAVLMIYDAPFDDAEYAAHFTGWGHSTWQAGVALARAAGVGRVLFHHHAPEHDDAALSAREAAIRAAAPNAGLARQGMTFRLGPDGLSEG